MKAYKVFRQIFTYSSLFEIYYKFIRHKRNVGLDKMTCDVFERNLDTNIESALNNVIDKNYRFTFYKARLISKGREKYPRVISIPSVRDRLILKSIHLLLARVYEDDTKNELVHTLISRLKTKISKYNYFLKIDIRNFYPSINHQKLTQILKRKIRKPEILNMLQKAITNKTLLSYKERIPNVEIGVPQGLSISNILASIYLFDLDNLFNRKRVFSYFRYVDDILILHNNPRHDEIKELIKKELQKLDLQINEEKIEEGNITDEFTYLGYKNTNIGFSVRNTSIESLHQSILKNITVYKHSDELPISYLEWIINLRITGCVFNKKKYGWMFFYSQIDDLTLLFKLDNFVANIILSNLPAKDRFVPKKFVRTYHEIINNLSKTKYIPNFTEYTIKQKKDVLSRIFGFENPFLWTDEKIDRIFSKKIFQSIKELEKDIQRFS